jgi:hypothetical protein
MDASPAKEKEENDADYPFFGMDKCMFSLFLRVIARLLMLLIVLVVVVFVVAELFCVLLFC